MLRHEGRTFPIVDFPSVPVRQSDVEPKARGVIAENSARLVGKLVQARFACLSDLGDFGPRRSSARGEEARQNEGKR
jgi:hypothetical protein